MASCVATWSGAARAAPLASSTCKQVCSSSLQAHCFYRVRSFLKPPLVLPQPVPFPTAQLGSQSRPGLERPPTQAAHGIQAGSLSGCKGWCESSVAGAKLYAKQLRKCLRGSSHSHGIRCDCRPEQASEAELSDGEEQESHVSSTFTQERAALGGLAGNMPERWDVVGLGQAMVDFSGTVSDDLLAKLGLEKGKRKVVDHEERGRVLQALDGKNYKVTAGGSLSNTLVALARLGQGAVGPDGGELLAPLSVAMTGSVGSDPLGQFYRAKLLRAGVHFLSTPISDGTTGTVVVLTTKDAQRTMLSYQGMSSEVEFDETLESSVSCARALVVEGYLWEIPRTIEAIQKATKAAKEQGCLVALTASDVTCVKRHRETFWNVMARDADLLFCNADEARALANEPSEATPHSLAQKLSCYCPMIVVTDGPAGSYLGLRGEVCYVPPWPCEPVDTCGAGDAYAAGILYGLLRGGLDLESMGNFAARVASVVVAQQGARLGSVDAQWLVGAPPGVAPGHLGVGGVAKVGSVSGVDLRVPPKTESVKKAGGLL